MEVEIKQVGENKTAYIMEKEPKQQKDGCLYCRDGEAIAFGDGRLTIKDGTLYLIIPMQEPFANEKHVPAFSDLHLRREYVFDYCPFCLRPFPKII